MGLDDREQRILAEIERRFYEEDPDLADAVRNITRASASRWRFRWAIIGTAVGLIVALGTVLWNTWVALGGFVILVVSAATLIQGLRLRNGRLDEPPTGSGGTFTARFRRRPPFQP